MRFSETPAAIKWLDQFDDVDKLDATALLDGILLVGMDALIDGIRSLILQKSAEINGTIGLYVERELKSHKKRPKPLFNEIKVPGENRIRAVGNGPSPVATQGRDPEVGSEGILSWLVTEICRENSTKFISHPGPDKIRERNARSFFLITDFVGSGKRAVTYLEAAWRVRSIKSWHSGRQLTFHVIAYSATSDGLERVMKHASRPEILILRGCPTVDEDFQGIASRIKSLCGRYDPIANHPILSLGFDGIGALIAFAHGCPNNAPRILHASSRDSSWKPLFAGRVTAPARKTFPSNEKSLEGDRDALRRLGAERLADSPWLSRLTSEGRAMLIILTALRRGPRASHALSRRTGLTIPEIEAAKAIARGADWITLDGKLTDSGLLELEQAMTRENDRSPLPKAEKALYLPTSLRMP